MHMNIDFPNLNLHFSHVGKSVEIFGISIAYYGIIIGCGILLAMALAMHEAKRTGQNPDNYLDLGLYGVIFGVIGARIYYVVFSWEDYQDNLLQIFNLRAGGLAIYGGVIAAVAVLCIYCKKKKLSLSLTADTALPCLLLGQAIGRWGNFFNREAFGEYTDCLFAMRLPLDAVNAENITELMKEHMETVDGVATIQVHPAFFYESVCSFALFILLMVCKKYKKFDGQIALMYLGGYGLYRFFIEGLRTDQLKLFGANLAVSQLLAGILFFVSAGFLARGFVKAKKAKV